PSWILADRSPATPAVQRPAAAAAAGPRRGSSPRPRPGTGLVTTEDPAIPHKLVLRSGIRNTVVVFHTGHRRADGVADCADLCVSERSRGPTRPPRECRPNREAPRPDHVLASGSPESDRREVSIFQIPGFFLLRRTVALSRMRPMRAGLPDPS